MQVFKTSLILLLFLGLCSCEDDPIVSFACTTEVTLLIKEDFVESCKYVLVSPDVDFQMRPINLDDYVDTLSQDMIFKIDYSILEDMASTCNDDAPFIEINCLEQ